MWYHYLILHIHFRNCTLPSKDLDGIPWTTLRLQYLQQLNNVSFYNVNDVCHICTSLVLLWNNIAGQPFIFGRRICWKKHTDIGLHICMCPIYSYLLCPLFLSSLFASWLVQTIQISTEHTKKWKRWLVGA